MFSRVRFALALGATMAACASTAPPQPDARRAALSPDSETPRELYVVLDGPAALEVVPPTASPTTPASTRLMKARIAAMKSERAALRPAIEATGATVLNELYRLANVVQVLATESQRLKLARLPGVRRTEWVPIIMPALASAMPVIGAPQAWAKSTPLQGDGIVIGIIDSGIDYTHADFGGSGNASDFAANDPTVIEPGTFPTAKVIGGFDFVGETYNPGGGSPNPIPDPDPIDCLKQQSMQVAGGHGTHVAGIAAGTGVASDGTTFTGAYEATFNPSAFRIAPGAAPRAKLFALKIFGCQGGTGQLSSALELAADPNQDGDVSDRLDVVNASLGTSYGLGSGVNVQMVKNLTAAGTLLVAAAGNDGEAFYATSSPGIIPEALSVAASADNQLVALQVAKPSSIAGQYAAAEGGFTKRLADSGPISGPLVASVPALGCGNFSNASAIAGKVALVDRGQCSFVNKFNNAIKAGAVAVVVVDNEEDALPFAMGGGDPGSVAIPGVMISKKDGAVLKAKLAEGIDVALDATVLFSGLGTEFMASFSARGPSAEDDRVKPEISAPGFSIDSARVGSGNLSRRSQGTSMAAPVVAGAAALMRQAQPTWPPMAIKAALMGSAEPVADLAASPYPVSISGAGRVNIALAADQTVTAAHDPASGTIGVSFGAHVAREPFDVKRSVTVENRGTGTATFDVAAAPTYALPGVTVTASPTKLTLAPGAKQDVELTLSVTPGDLGAPGPDPVTSTETFGQPRHFMVEGGGLLRLEATGAAPSLTVPYYSILRAAAERAAAPLPECPTGQSDGPVTVAIEGPTAHPNPVVTAFELGAESDEHPASATNPAQSMVDLRAVGVATDFATRTFDEASAFFGVAVTGQWPTVARGPVSVVSIVIDSDLDGTADYVVRAEALTRDGPYADVIAATTYNAKTGQQTQSKRFINIVSASQLDTAPFQNGVIVLGTFLKDIGLSEGQTQFAYAAASQSLDLSIADEQTAWVTFDASQPRIDTAKNGLEGRPIYTGAQPVLVDVAGDAAKDGPLPRLLLLHHHNVPGKRFEVLDLADPNAPPGNLALTATPPPNLVSEASGDFLLTIENQGGQAVTGVTLEGSLTIATLAAATATQGSCVLTPALKCELGEIAAGATAMVKLLAKAPATAEPVIANLEAKVSADSSCETSLSDNRVSLDTSIDGKIAIESERFPSGGCAGCRVGGRRPTGHLAFAALAVLGLTLLRRRHRA